MIVVTEVMKGRVFVLILVLLFWIDSLTCRS